MRNPLRRPMGKPVRRSASKPVPRHPLSNPKYPYAYFPMRESFST
jgi:hypothetical protein